MQKYLYSILATCLIAFPSLAFTGESGVVQWDPNAACIAAGIRSDLLLNYLRIASILVPAILLTIIATCYITIKARAGFFRIFLLFLSSVLGFFVLSLPNLLFDLDELHTNWNFAHWSVHGNYHVPSTLALIFACVMVILGGYLLRKYLEKITVGRVSVVVPVLIVGISVLPWLYLTPYLRASVGIDPLVRNISGCA
jgi:hypothetical protein